MKSKILGVLAASIFALPAWSDNGHGHGSGSGSGSGSTPTSSASSSATGGAGGAGGSATGGAASGGSATGGSSNVNVNVSGLGGGGDGNGGVGPAAAALGDVGAAGSSAYNTKATVDYGGSYKVKSVPAVLSPSLTATLSDTCMGSVSAGVSAVGFGITGGMTMVDEACVRRLDSREFRAMGMNDVALALLCQSDANRKAIEATGRSCPSAPQQQAAVTTYSVSASQSGDQYTDPIVRQRLGLAPLPN